MILPSQSMVDFEFDSAKFSPGFTAPPSPARIGDCYFSAPTSPRHVSEFYAEFDEFLMNETMDSDVGRNSVSLTVPFGWEEKQGVPKLAGEPSNDMFEDDFAFDVSQEMDTASLTADVLFDGGKIKPRELHKSSEMLREEGGIRGRERSVSSLSSSRSRHRVTRSLSPMRVSEYPWEEEFKYQQQQQLKNDQQNSKQPSSKPNLTSSVSTLSSTSLKGLKKWKLKDFFLFRSASEGRATDKVDPLKKYASLFKKQEDVKSSSFRTIHNDSGNSVHSSKRKGKGPVSAHELHYTINRAVSEDLKKKTFLPYKQGILGRLSFNPAVHAIANGFGFSRK